MVSEPIPFFSHLQKHNLNPAMATFNHPSESQYFTQSAQSSR